MTRLTLMLPLPPVELSKNGRANPWERNSIFQQHKMIARAAINAKLQSGFQPWPDPVHVEAVWQQANPRYWPDQDNLIERLAAYVDASEDAGLIVDDNQVAGYTVEYVKSDFEGVWLTFNRIGYAA